MPEQKIAVLGAGANGAAIGADLTEAGLDVTLIDQWPANVEAMRAGGVRVEMPDEVRKTPVRAIHLCDLATLREKFDVVLVVVKAYDTQWACELIRPHLKPDGLAAGLQNGLTADAMARVLGPRRTLGCVIEIAAAMYQPGRVERHTPPPGTWFAVGSLTDATRGREAEVAALLGNAGTVEIVPDIRSAKWMKLVVNTAELVTSAILNLPLHEAARVPGMHDFMLRNGRESMRAAIMLGHRVVPVFGLTDTDPGDPDGFLSSMLDAVYSRWSLPHTRTTVLQDWDKGRHSEVDELNGVVVRELGHLGQAAPANARTLRIADLIERGKLKPSPANAGRLLAPL